MAESLHESGFAVLVGHSITTTQLIQFYQSWDEFFVAANKQPYTVDPVTQAGYFSIEDAEKAKAARAQDLKEYYQFWPGTRLPEAQQAVTLGLYDQMYDLAIDILGALQNYLPDSLWQGLEKSLPHYLSRQDTMIRILRYPPLTGREPPDAMRAAPHEDINFITLLPAATQTGLQIKPSNADWQPVNAPPGAIIVNIGDMLQELTGRLLPSTTHRVINPADMSQHQPRITAPLFCHPEPSLRLSPEYTAGDYLRERLNEINTQPLRLN